MRLLLDTHLAAWSLSDDPRLSKAGASFIADPDNELIVSAVVFWEIAIKRGLSRGNRDNFIHSPKTAHDLFVSHGAVILPVTPKHTFAVEQLPSLHNDPFDRLLIAQSVSEGLRFLTHDKRLAAYSDTVILV